ncbi:protein kinase domain-containing protein [Phormidesmis sp. 146-12]
MEAINSDSESPQLPSLEKPLGGRYKVVQQLGMGGFSQTFIAEDLHLPNCPRCVIKQLKPHFETEQDLQTARRLFDTEAKVLYLLGNHDQIPRLLAHFEEDHKFYLAQELVEGETLNQLLVDHQLWTEAEVMTLLRDSLNVLAFVHRQGVIHRDIKPSNLICRQSDGRIILIDFGAVKQVSLGVADAKSGKTDLTVSIGTQGYTANEQLAGEPHFSSDIYAIGMVAIQALTGIRPKHLKKDPYTHEFRWCEEGTPVCEALVNLLDCMVRYDFRERYPTANEALAALHTLSDYFPEYSPESPTSSESGSLPFKPLLLMPAKDPLEPVHFSKKPLYFPSSSSERSAQRQSTDGGSSQTGGTAERSPNSPASEIQPTELQDSLKMFLKRLVSVRGLVAVGFTVLMANALLSSLPSQMISSSTQEFGSSPVPTQEPQPSESTPSVEVTPGAEPVPSVELTPSVDLSHPPSFGQVQKVPPGLFNYGGSTTWAHIRREVDPILQASHPEFRLRYTHPVNATAGSGTGIQMLLEGQLAFSQSSRPIEEREYQQAQLRGFSLNQIPVALEGIAIAVHPSLSIPGLNLSQIQGIYTGKITNWQQVGGPNRAIIPYSRPVADSGTAEFFVKNVLGGSSLGNNVRYVDNTTAGLQKLSTDPGGIYYASAPEVVSQCGVRALPIAQESNNFVSPYQEPLVPAETCFKQKNQLNAEAFKAGEYPITRQLFVIVKQDGQTDQQAGEAYAHMLLTSEGQELISKAGFVRIR